MQRVPNARWIGGRLLDSGEPVYLTIEESRITRIEPATNLMDRWIAPGLIDIQVNGFGGHDINAPDVSPETVIQLTRLLWRQGITAYCPTVITNTEERICRSLAAIAAARASDPLIARSIPYSHIEGPHISPEDGPRGAHPAAHVRPPDLAEYRRWQEAAAGTVGIVTLSPEYPDAPAYIRALANDGVVAAIGHTAASSEQIAAAVRAGARLSTHLGNGAHATLPRHPNYLWDQLADDRLIASFIFDGHHLPPAVMKTMLRAKGTNQSILVSDTVAQAGLPPGHYQGIGGSQVDLADDGRLTLRGTLLLAGAVLPLPSGIANAVRLAGVTLPKAVAMASSNPARLLGLHDRGEIRVGAAADLTVLRYDAAAGEIKPLQTLVGGETVYAQESSS